MPDVILIGASVRSLADSCSKAGVSPFCIDLFRDADLLEAHPESLLCPVAEYPNGFVQLLEQTPRLPVIYSGGLENYPELISNISCRQPVWGNIPETLRKVRNPFILQEIARTNIGNFPATSKELPVTTTTRWLKKPLRGSAGRGIEFVVNERPDHSSFYFQQLIDGHSMSALFFGTNKGIQRIGITEQLIGCDWLHAQPFWYCGNVGPIELSTDLTQKLHSFAQHLWDAAGPILGQFGIDFILADDQIWILEVNPRPTASFEVFDRLVSIPLFRGHLAAFTAIAFDQSWKISPNRMLGKAVWYTPYACRAAYHPEELPPRKYADMPHHGQEFGSNEPFVTMFAEGSDRDAVLQSLREIALEVPHRFRLMPV